MKYGPDRKELYVRLALCGVGLALLVAALVLRGVPNGPAFFEVIVVGGGFLVASVIWCLIKLRNLPPKE